MFGIRMQRMCIVRPMQRLYKPSGASGGGTGCPTWRCEQAARIWDWIMETFLKYVTGVKQTYEFAFDEPTERIVWRRIVDGGLADLPVN